MLRTVTINYEISSAEGRLQQDGSILGFSSEGKVYVLGYKYKTKTGKSIKKRGNIIVVI